MVLLHSENIELGQPAPPFNLKSVDGPNFTMDSFKSAKAVVVLFICNHCPYVVAIEDRILQLHHEYHRKGVQLVGICSNDPTDYPEDSPENLRKRWLEKDYGFPYLIDDTQQVAKAFGAVCTPDIYAYDGARRLAYHGRLDDNWKQPDFVKHRELAEALDAMLAGRPQSPVQNASMGCSIKWKK